MATLWGNCYGFVIYDCLASWPLLHLDYGHLSFSQHRSISVPIIFFALHLIRATTPNMSQVKNLRAMFENKGDTSPPDRGRSPGVSSTRHIEGKPLVVQSKLFSCFTLFHCASLLLLWLGYAFSFLSRLPGCIIKSGMRMFQSLVLLVTPPDSLEGLEELYM